MVSLPDALRIKANGLQLIQAGVYEDFGETHYVFISNLEFICLKPSIRNVKLLAAQLNCLSFPK
jgi:hypothetical protein